jgi:GTP-binding nuclear protein Ran
MVKNLQITNRQLMASQDIRTIKVVILGDSGVGKTAFLKRQCNGAFEMKYNASTGVEISSLNFDTNKGTVIFNVWDCAGQEEFDGIRDGIRKGHWIMAQIFIVMFDVTSFMSYRNAKGKISLIRRIYPDIPIILCGNKVDCQYRKVKVEDIADYCEFNCDAYCDISVRSKLNLETPFQRILQLLDEDITFNN